MSEHTVLLIGTHRRYRDEVYDLARDSRDLGGDPRRGMVTIDGVRYVHVGGPEQAQGYDRASTTFRVIGGYSDGILDAALSICRSRYAYERRAVNDAEAG
jgi:hypothetical protein